jgi:hypothetical protein
MVVTFTYSLISEISLSRWSSRSLGWMLEPRLPEICALISATRAASAVTVAAECCMSLRTPACKMSSRSAALEKRSDTSAARASTAWRAELSPGALARSTIEAKNSPIE